MSTDQRTEDIKIESNLEAGLTVRPGDDIIFSDFRGRLTNFGYSNVSPGNVEKTGEFSIRGGVVDIWLERYKLPARIDLIGEKTESIYLFNFLTQEKSKVLKEVYIVPYGITPRLGSAWVKKHPTEKYERLFLSEIKPGDLVVHIDYGIGKFVGISNAGLAHQQFESSPKGPADGPKNLNSKKYGRGLPVEIHKLGELAVRKQFLVIEYADGGKLFVPVDQIERLTKYIGAGGRKPALSRLGTGGWERTRQKVEADVYKYARGLLQIYAERELVKRPPYPVDSPWQKQLEEDFTYAETEDQAKTLSEIKKDLESQQPMDRLLVGDVGFGKTEVAIRAAFKVVQESKQVAVLVPTTILADQHWCLFKERLKNFPVKVDMLSRFKSEDEQKKVLEGLKLGKIDIVIGTHRLLSKDISFKDLGLLIIDEEHRFGVRHKEKLKSLRPAVDILSMSATPIPRSLQMALTKIRSMSTIERAPVGRKSVETFVGETDREKIRLAIESEINRGGQVYFVFNNIDRIAGKAMEISQLVTRARVVYAHGQMDRRMRNSEFKVQNLEKAMEKFYSGRADVLVCTTIIGSGLDMPTVNTIIIEDAHRFGLADLYQLRGRVGRSDKKAFAYLFYPKNWVPEGAALERLTAISSATELGSGFKIARQDLEIRGAGNLLGTAQSGNIALVGFELYIQLLAHTVEKLKH